MYLKVIDDFCGIVNRGDNDDHFHKHNKCDKCELHFKIFRCFEFKRGVVGEFLDFGKENRDRWILYPIECMKRRRYICASRDLFRKDGKIMN